MGFGPHGLPRAAPDPSTHSTAWRRPGQLGWPLYHGFLPRAAPVLCVLAGTLTLLPENTCYPAGLRHVGLSAPFALHVCLVALGDARSSTGSSLGRLGYIFTNELFAVWFKSNTTQSEAGTRRQSAGASERVTRGAYGDWKRVPDPKHSSALARAWPGGQPPAGGGIVTPTKQAAGVLGGK